MHYNTVRVSSARLYRRVQEVHTMKPCPEHIKGGRVRVAVCSHEIHGVNERPAHTQALAKSTIQVRSSNPMIRTEQKESLLCCPLVLP